MNQSNPLKSSQITPKEIYQKRRSILMSSLSLAAGSIGLRHSQARAQTDEPKRLTARPNPAYVLLDKPTPYKSVTGYNNFYELGTGKSDPAEQAHRLKTRPWTVRVDGLVNRPKTFDIDDLIKLAPLEERVYRLRCVEGWSMVIPWIGYPLHHLLRQVQPQGSAKFVEFVTLADPNQMPGLARRVLDWPYREGLRLDEAQHSLTLLTFGLYGEVLPGQNGAPIRVVTPWKYGFKSPKSIVSIRLTDTMPQTSWNVVAPFAYGFYANVNPEVDHPRWSQATERRIGDEGGFFAPRRKTLMFNGYAEQVASLYSGMDLSRHF